MTRYTQTMKHYFIELVFVTVIGLVILFQNIGVVDAQSCSNGGPGYCPNSQSCVCDSVFMGDSDGAYGCSCQSGGGGINYCEAQPGTYSVCDQMGGYGGHYPNPGCKCCALGQNIQAAGLYTTAYQSNIDCSPGDVQTAWYYDGYYDICVPSWDEHCDDQRITLFHVQCRQYTCQSACSATAPTGLTITNGPNPGTTAQVNWTPGTGGTTQLIRVGTDLPSVQAGCSPQACAYTSSPTIYDNSALVANLQPLTTYWFRVVTYKDGACYRDQVASFTTPASTGAISGNVYLDTNNTCSTATPWTAGGTVSLDSGAGTAISGTGTFSVNALLSASHTLAMNIPSGYICSNNSSCSAYPCTIAGITAPAAGKKFFLTQNRGAWWQVQGAGVYAGGAVTSVLPFSTSRLILPASGGTAAALVHGSGSTSFGNGSVSDSVWTAKSLYKGKKMDYAYFAAQMGVLPTQANDWGADTMNKPGTTKDFHYIDPQSSTATVSSPWVVNSGEKYIVFVNGNLRIGANTTVANGGFLTFIVNGDVTIDPAVTSVQGMHIASGNFTTETVDGSHAVADSALEMQGNVIAWGTFSLGRSLISGNTLGPAESFVYRPDLLTNMPDKMKTFAMNWQEVAPGTFGE